MVGRFQWVAAFAIFAVSATSGAAGRHTTGARAGERGQLCRFRPTARRPRSGAGFHRQHHHARHHRLYDRPPRLRGRFAQRDVAQRTPRDNWCSARRDADACRFRVSRSKSWVSATARTFPAGAFHWHGAAPNENFTMVFITMGASKMTQGEPVTEAVYRGK